MHVCSCVIIINNSVIVAVVVWTFLSVHVCGPDDVIISDNEFTWTLPTVKDPVINDKAADIYLAKLHIKLGK